MDSGRIKKLEEAVEIMNGLGLLEGLRILAEEGVNGDGMPLLPGRDFLVVPYQAHLARLSIRLELKKDVMFNDPRPRIVVPDLILLDVLPDYFRVHCSGYLYKHALSKRGKDKKKPMTPKQDDEHQRTRWFGAFVNEFLNACLYQIGTQAWRGISILFRGLTSSQIAQNPVLRSLYLLQAYLQKASEIEPRIASLRELAWSVSLMSFGMMDRGRFEWGVRQLFRTLWPANTPQVQFPGNHVTWNKLHPGTMTYLGVQKSRLNSTFRLGKSVKESCSTLRIQLTGVSAQAYRELRPGLLHERLFWELRPDPPGDSLSQELRPGLLRNSLSLIMAVWLQSAQLRIVYEIEAPADRRALAWRLGPQKCADKPPGVLGYSAFLG